MITRRRLTIVAIAAALAALAVVAPEIYRGTFSDAGTFLRVAALAGGLAIWVVAVRRFVPHTATAAVVAGLPVVVAAWVVLWPYLRPATEVDEAFPPVVVTTSITTSTTITTPTTTTVPPTSPPADAADSGPPTTTTSPTIAPTTTVAPTTTAAPEPVELSRSGFQGLTGHRGSGDAAVYRLADDSILLRFEEVDIGSGPDLEVYLVPGSDQRGLGGGHHVAGLTAERGNQNYTVPDGVDLTTGTWTVLVWCETFDVEVANATLTL